MALALAGCSIGSDRVLVRVEGGVVVHLECTLAPPVDARRGR